MPAKRLPKLNEAQLTIALQRLNSLPVSQAVKTQLAGVLRSAANSDSQKVDVVISQLEASRREPIVATMQGVNAVFNSAAARGAQALQAVSDAEFQELVEKANAK